MNKTHYLAHMTSPEIAALDKQSGIVVLPIGAIEQHGPHLPLITDTMLATHALDATLAQLPEDVRVWTLPPQSYGKSNEHINYAGTITLSAETLIAVLHDIAASVARAGFRRLAFLNGHGGNMPLLNMVARDIRVATGLMTFCIHGLQYGKPSFGMSKRELTYGLHGGETETSLMLAMAPELVKMELAPTSYPDFPETDTGLFFFGNVSAAWLADDWSETGIYGDATLGSAEKGHALLEASVRNLTRILTVLSTFEVKKKSNN
ncbi:MAG: creatininase family protein [Chloroflexota bacterium]